MYVNNAFSHGDLDEQVYMKSPSSFQRKVEDLMQRLHKSLYGLKQDLVNGIPSFLLPHVTLVSHILRLIIPSFILHNGSDSLFVALFVDDLIIIGINSFLIDSMKTTLHNQFHIKDLRSLKYFLSIEVARSRFGLYLCQHKYSRRLCFQWSPAG